MSSSPSSLVKLVCPACKQPVVSTGADWKCPSCNRPFTRNQGILSFLTPEERFNESVFEAKQIEAWTKIDQEITTFQKAIRFFVALKKSKTNTAAVQMQAFAKALSQDPAYAHVLPLVTTMNDARLSKKSKAKSEPQTPGNPTPQNGGPILTL